MSYKIAIDKKSPAFPWTARQRRMLVSRRKNRKQNRKASQRGA